MIYGSVCSGVEAATVAWEPLGWKAAWYAEIDEFPSELLNQKYPDIPNLGNMEHIHNDERFKRSTIDVLVGGTPCQSFSVAGLRAGMADPRGNLMLTYLKIAATSRARWLVWENVPGVLSANGGRDFGAFLGGLAELGYGFAYRILDSQYFGVPQRRRRVFVIGCLGSWQRAAAVLHEREGMFRNPPPSRAQGKGATESVSKCLTGNSGGVDREDRHTLIWPDAPAHTLQTTCDDWSRSDGFNVVPIHDSATRFAGKRADKQDGKGNGLGIGNHGDPAPTLGTSDRHAVAFDTTQITNPDNRSNPQPGDPCHTLNAQSHPPTIAFGSKGALRDVNDNLSPTLAAGNNANSKQNGGTPPAIAFKPGQSAQANSLGAQEELSPTLESGGGGNNRPAIQSGMTVRRLTPRECERLQGFPDDYTKISYRGKSAEDCPDGHRYKAMGNSMTVPVMAWIGKRISEVDEIE